MPSDPRWLIPYLTASDSGITQSGDAFWQSLFDELRRLGYVEGQNLLIERRELAPELALITFQLDYSVEADHRGLDELLVSQVTGKSRVRLWPTLS